MASAGLERRTIDVIPDDERHGTPRNQFTLWFGANMQITAIVDGALAVVFGADALWAIIGLAIGNILGGIVMALHSAQGPRLGLPQMISSRAQFGVYGAVVPLVLVIVMYLGFAATGTVLSGQAINNIIGVDAPGFGIVIFGVLTGVVAILGYRFIHIWAGSPPWWGSSASPTRHPAVRATRLRRPGRRRPGLATFLLAVSLGAGWQLTFGPYVADYSRYLPRDTPASTTFWATFAGTVIGSSWAMALGALAASLPAAADGGFTANQVGFLGDLAGGAVVALIIYLVIVTGKLTVNSLNAYGGFMCALTTVSAFTRTAPLADRPRAGHRGFLAVSVIIALAATADFLEYFKNFVLLLLMVFTPWSRDQPRRLLPDLQGALRRSRALRPGGTLRRLEPGCARQLRSRRLDPDPVPGSEALHRADHRVVGGADVSWLVGLLGTAAIYYPLASDGPTRRPR